MGVVVRAAGAVVAFWLVLLVARRLVASRVVGRRGGSVATVPGVGEIIEVEPGLWRGPAPTEAGYRELAERGVSLIVDLRGEAVVDDVAPLAEAAELEYLRLPIGNGRAPDAGHVVVFSATHASSRGITYVHCEAGEGRTGSIIGAHLVEDGRPVAEVIADQLAIGSLTFAQMLFIASAGRAGPAIGMTDVLVDRPTEAAFDLLRAGRSTQEPAGP